MALNNMALTNEFVLEKIRTRFPEAVLQVDEPHGLLTLEVTPEINVELLQFVKEDKDLQMAFLTDICGIHYPDQVGRELGVIYHVHSLIHNHRLRFKCFLPAQDPKIRTAVGVFAGANWMERETFDFFGIQFAGHPNLIRILNMEDMTYHPLLKQYPLEDPTREDKNDTYFGR